MTKRVVYWNGELIPENEAKVSIYDSGIIAGDMAYEVTRTINQRAFCLMEHLERLQSSMNLLQIEAGLSLDEWEQATLQTLEANLPSEAKDVDWQIIHQVSSGPSAGFALAFEVEQRRPTIFISCYPLTSRLARMAKYYETGVEILIPPQRAIPSQWLPAHVKSRGRLQYLLANLQAEKLQPGSWPVLVDPMGFVTEGTSFNVFFVHEGKLCTPPVEDVLVGVTRGLVLKLAQELSIPTVEDSLPLAFAQQADEVFVTSTSIGILHARAFDGQQVGDGSVGPVTSRLRAALHENLELDFAAQARLYASRM